MTPPYQPHVPQLDSVKFTLQIEKTTISFPSDQTINREQLTTVLTSILIFFKQSTQNGLDHTLSPQLQSLIIIIIGSTFQQMMIKSSLTHPVAFVAAAAHILLHLAPFPTFSFIIGKVASVCYLDDKLLLTCWSPPLFPSSSPSCSPCPRPRSPGSPCCTCPPSLRSLLFRVIAPLLRMADPQNLSFFGSTLVTLHYVSFLILEQLFSDWL